MTRINLVDSYDNRSVVAKLVNMEERISGAETSVEASAEAAASSASAAAASQTAAKTSETNAKASADTAAATLANTVDLSSKQTVTGAKTFAGDTTVTGSFVTSGNAEMAKLDIDTGKLTIGSGGSAEINGPLTATNPANVLQAANHDSVLTSNDVLTAKDINEVNGKGNNLLHRSGAFEQRESKIGLLSLAQCLMTVSNEGTSRELFRLTPIKGQSNRISILIQVSSSNNSRLCFGVLEFVVDSGGVITAVNSTKTVLAQTYTTPITIGVTKNSDDTISISSSTYGATSYLVMASYTGSRFTNTNIDFANLGTTVSTVDYTQSW